MTADKFELGLKMKCRGCSGTRGGNISIIELLIIHSFSFLG